MGRALHLTSPEEATGQPGHPRAREGPRDPESEVIFVSLDMREK